MDWDHLRYFLELARSGKLSAAARRLEVQHTTVARRIRSLEQLIGAPLFIRVAGEYRVSEAGRELVPHAEAMERACQAIEGSTARGGSDALSGLVRVGATEGFGTVVLAPALARLGQQHPQLVLDLLAVPRTVNLSRREADIVVSLERPVLGHVVAVRLCNYVLRLYASADYLAQHPPIRSRDELQHHPFISYIDDLLFSKELRYLAELCRPRHYALRSTSVLAQHQAVVQGAGIGVLPAFLAEHDPRLIPVLPGEADFQRTFWMSMPQENQSVARMRVTWDALLRAADGLRGPRTT